MTFEHARARRRAVHCFVLYMFLKPSGFLYSAHGIGLRILGDRGKSVVQGHGVFIVCLVVDVFRCFSYMRLSCGCYHCSEAVEIDFVFFSSARHPCERSVLAIPYLLPCPIPCVLILLVLLLLSLPLASFFSFLVLFLPCPHPPSPPPPTFVFLKVIPPCGRPIYSIVPGGAFIGSTC